MDKPKLRIIRIRETAERVGLQKSQIEALEKAGKFPRRVRISDRAVGHVESEIDAWLESRNALRDSA